MLFKYPELNFVKVVNSQEELRKVIYELHDKFDLRGSNWDWDGAKLVDDLGIQHKVAYNGRLMS